MKKLPYFKICMLTFLLLAMAGLPAVAQESELPPGHPTIPPEKVVGASGEMTISLPHLLIEAREDGTRSVSAYVLTAAPGTGAAGPREFIFGLPAGATAPLRVQAAGAPREFPPDRIREVPEKGAWVVELPPWEGEIQVTVEALSPLKLKEAGFKQRFFYPVTEATLLVRPPDLTIAGKGVQFAGVIEAMHVSQWIGPPIEAGGLLDLHVHEHIATETRAEESDILAMPNRMTMPKAALLLIFLGLLAVAVAVSARQSG